MYIYIIWVPLADVFGNVHKKTPVLQSLFNEVVRKHATLFKRDSSTGAFL